MQSLLSCILYRVPCISCILYLESCRKIRDRIYTHHGKNPLKLRNAILVSCISCIVYLVGRYAIVPITVKPLHVEEAFLLELAADNTVEWEQDGDRVPDLDQPLRVRTNLLVLYLRTDK